MTEERIGFLCNIATSLSSENDSHKLLKSYYLMRCNELTRGYGLPMKHFSKEVRCPNCCIEWSRDTLVNVQPSNIHKTDDKDSLKHRSKKSLQHCNNMVQTCSFCKQSTKTQLAKPEKHYIKKTDTVKTTQIVKNDVAKNKITNIQQKKDKNKGIMNVKNIQKNAIINTQKKANIIKETKKNKNVNVYSNAFDVFSLKNEKNTLSTSIKEPAKVIKNNKKKKDKYAGLCQKAVLASAKLKEQKETEQKSQNKLNLFLKPST